MKQVSSQETKMGLKMHKNKFQLLFVNLTKKFVKNIFMKFNMVVLFPGERSERGLFPSFIEFFLTQSRGILHIGGHHGQESSYYKFLDKPVLWIEADPIAFSILSKRISSIKNQKALNCIVSDQQGNKTFYITSNDGMSSSVYPLSTLGESSFGIQNEYSIVLEANTIDNLYPQDSTIYDFWILDVQGHEYQVLQGGKETLIKARWILIEGSRKEFYEDMILFPKVKKLLESFGFVQVYCPSAEHFEALFINSFAKES